MDASRIASPCSPRRLRGRGRAGGRPHPDHAVRGRARRPRDASAARPGRESDAHTTEVALQIPKGVLPFSYEDQPGWRRTVENAADGSVGVVRWRGRLASDGFVRFAFLAGTPEQEGELVWKAVQRYDDGEEAAWIGAPDSDNPAPVTRSARARRARTRAARARASRGRAGRAAARRPRAAADDGGGGERHDRHRPRRRRAGARRGRAGRGAARRGARAPA